MKQLTKVEADVMKYIWRLKRCTVSQIIEELGHPKPPHSTISSIVRILEKKSFVDHEAVGRTHIYYPLISQSQYKRYSLMHIINDYFDHSVENLVSFLIDEKEIGLQELQEIINEEE